LLKLVLHLHSDIQLHALTPLAHILGVFNEV
jgi:hypothetical protein